MQEYAYDMQECCLQILNIEIQANLYQQNQCSNFMGNQKFINPIQPILHTYHIKKEFQKIKI